MRVSKYDGGRYEIREDGTIYSLVNNAGNPKEPTLKAQGLCANGYMSISLQLDGKTRVKSVHRLIAEAFVPNPDNKPVVNHINGIKTDNRASNLEWVTHSENDLHAYKTGLRKATRPMLGVKGGDNPLAKRIGQYTMEGHLVKEWDSIVDTKKEGFNTGCIGHVLKGTRKHHKNFKWAYLD